MLSRFKLRLYGLQGIRNFRTASLYVNGKKWVVCTCKINKIWLFTIILSTTRPKTELYFDAKIKITAEPGESQLTEYRKAVNNRTSIKRQRMTWTAINNYVNETSALCECRDATDHIASRDRAAACHFTCLWVVRMF